MSTDEDRNVNGDQNPLTADMPKADGPEGREASQAAKAEGAESVAASGSKAQGGWSAKKKGVVAGIAAVVVVACIGCGIAAAGQQSQPAQEGQATEQDEGQNGESAKHYVEVSIAAEGWDDNSSPMILHVVGTDADGNPVDFYHAFTAGGDMRLEIADGSYTLSWVSAINADGSIYKVPEAAELKVEGGAAKAESSFEQIPADQVTADDLNAVLDKVTEAVEKGDSTLAGDAGKAAVDKAVANASASPNANKEQVEAKAEVAGAVAQAKAEGKDAASAKQEAQQKAPAAVTQNAGSQAVSGGSSSGSGGSSESAHQHSWQAVTKTVHHDAQYETVHHDAVTKTIRICNDCGQEGADVAHRNMEIDRGNSGSYRVVTKTVQSAYDEHVLVSSAYDETVTVGYKCSCGATK